MADSRGDDRPPFEGDVVIVRGDGSEVPGPARPPGRSWTTAARRTGAALGIVAVFVFGIVVGRTSTGSPANGPSAPAPTTAGTTTSRGPVSAGNVPSTNPVGPTEDTAGSVGPPAAARPPLLNSEVASAIEFGLGAPDVQAMAVVGDQIVALASGLLMRVSLDAHGGLYPGRTSAVGLPIGDPAYAEWELIAGENAVWAFAPGKRLYSVDASTLAMGPLIRAPSGTLAAAVLDGRLYLDSNVGVYEVPSSGHGGTWSVVASGGRAMAADPVRHRLLVVDDGGRRIHAYAPPDRAPVASAPLPFETTSITVAAGEIWVTGMTSGADPRPVLARLDPATLRVVGHSALEASLTSPPTVVAGGASLWIRSADGGSELWCVNPLTGAVAQRWSALPGIVAAGAGRAFVSYGGSVGMLHLNDGCAG